MFRQLRILFALLLLFFVGISTWLTSLHLASWADTLEVYIYPINADGSQSTQRYIDSLNDRRFDDIERFMTRQAKRYLKLQEQPFNISLSPQVHDIPPAPTANSSIPANMLLSLKLRLWAWTHNSDPRPDPDIKVYTLFYNPQNINRLPHSIGLSKGQIGVVHAFASTRYKQSNNIVIAHELMHTLGASDKYDLNTTTPIYPIGYANPDKRPLYPQQKAELMGGRIPVSASTSTMPRRFSDVVIGTATAREISWLKVGD